MYIAHSKGSGHLKKPTVSWRDIGPQPSWLYIIARSMEVKNKTWICFQLNSTSKLKIDIKTFWYSKIIFVLLLSWYVWSRQTKDILQTAQRIHAHRAFLFFKKSGLLPAFWLLRPHLVTKINCLPFKNVECSWILLQSCSHILKMLGWKNF